MPDFFTRLREERKKLGLNQEKFGLLGGVTKDSQLKYETGKRTPDADYLAKIAAAGADVQYLITGVRSSHLPASETAESRAEYRVNTLEQAVVELFFALDKNQQRNIVEELKRRNAGG